MSRENVFENKRVVIVGGSSGIGLAVAEQAASQGAKVVIASSNAERVQKAIKAVGGEAKGLATLPRSFGSKITELDWSLRRSSAWRNSSKRHGNFTQSRCSRLTRLFSVAIT